MKPHREIFLKVFREVCFADGGGVDGEVGIVVFKTDKLCIRFWFSDAT